tara:strand:+ start:1127 stop:1876 length:750 start_codon:yes stop_codon:yes gene_type:complete
MREINLPKIIKKLLNDDLYYVSIPPIQTKYEEDYHEVTIDPDGKKRFLLEEREHNLKGIPEIVRWVGQMSAGKLLDIGCGPGWFLSSLGDEWDKHGVEISSFAANLASKYAKVFNGNLENYNESNFDIIVMNHVIEHLPDPISALKKIKRILKKSGKLILGTPDFDSAAARRYGDNFRLLHDPTHVSLFSQESMYRCLRDLGFHIDDVEFPFFETQWFNRENILKILDKDGISPPFYGSNMTFLCSHKK